MATGTIKINGLVAAQKQAIKMIEALRPEGGQAKAVLAMGQMAFKAAVDFTHVATNTLKPGRLMDFIEEVPEAIIFTDENAINPITGQRAAEYDVFEQARGGSHATYPRVIVERGFQIGTHGIAIMIRELDK